MLSCPSRGVKNLDTGRAHARHERLEQGTDLPPLPSHTSGRAVPHPVVRSLPRARLARFSQIDYDREMALVAIERDSDGVEHSLGEVRAVAEPGNAFADFAVVVRSALKGQGLGRLLMQSLISYCRRRGIGELRGEALDGNLRMQRLAKHLGFQLTTGADRGTVDLRLRLREPEKV